MIEYPYVPIHVHVSYVMGRNNPPLVFMQFSNVCLWCHNGVPVRLIGDGNDMFLNNYSTSMSALFPGITIGTKVRLSEMKFHFIRMMGEESHKIIEPFIDKTLGVNKP